MKEAIKVNVSWDKSSVLEGGDVVLEYAEQGLNGMRGKTGVRYTIYVMKKNICLTPGGGGCLGKTCILAIFNLITHKKQS